MKMPGFSLLELVIALLISSLLAAGLFVTLSQISLVEVRTSNITSVYTRAAIFLNQIERDLMGAFIPTQTKVIQRAVQPGAPAEKKVEPIKTVFSSIIKEGRLEWLTFITDNPLVVYTKAKNAKINPRIARVVYRLIPDSAHKKSFILTRQEGKNLSVQAYTEKAQGALRPYELLDGIADVQIAFYIPDSKQEGDKKTIQYKRLTSFSGNRKSDGEEEITIESLPHYVEIVLTLWDSQYEKKSSFTMTIPITVPSAMKQSMAQSQEAEPAAEKLAPQLGNTQNVMPSAAPAALSEPGGNKLAGRMDFLPEKLRKGITIKEGGSIVQGVAA